MPFSLLALIIFLIVYAIIAYGVYSSRKMQYDERQKYIHRILYKIILGYSISRIIYHYLHRSYRIFYHLCF